MFDMKEIRDNPEHFDKSWARRGLGPQTSAILDLDRKRREIQTRLQELQHERNEKSRQIGEIKKAGGDATETMNAVTRLKDKMSELEDREKTLAESLNQHLAALPNIMAADVPDGADEDENVEIRSHLEPVEGKETPEHFEIGEALGMMDFETAAKMSGARFVLLNNGVCRLERALANYFLDIHTNEHGYIEVSPPLLVKDNAMYWSDKLPKFDNGFRLDEGYWLIPTSEVPLACIVAEKILDQEELPLRFTAFTPCFRSEAGAAGKDTRGMIRQHQFYKVELVSVTHPEKSEEEHERMTACAEKVLKNLGLPFRTVTLCSGDTGFGAQKTYDIEVWLPGQGRYREISSCSNCGPFQARRMKARFRKKGEKETSFVHTLNGSGVAVGRALIAILENYYDPEDGGVFIPDVLKPYMGGIEKITATDKR